MSEKKCLFKWDNEVYVKAVVWYCAGRFSHPPIQPMCGRLSCSVYSLLHHSHLCARTPLVASLQPSNLHEPLRWYSVSMPIAHLLAWAGPWKMCTIQLCSRKRQEQQDCPAPKAEFGECQILFGGSPLRWWTLHNKRTLGLLLFIPTCGAVCTSSWAPTRGDLRHFSREEKALGGQLAT